MATGPALVRNSFRADADALEIEIDMALKNIKGAKGATVYKEKIILHMDRYVDPEVQDFLRPRYLSAGWSKMEFRSDQRDGRWIELYF